MIPSRVVHEICASEVPAARLAIAKGGGAGHRDEEAVYTSGDGEGNWVLQHLGLSDNLFRFMVNLGCPG
jgi:hypothetical protein